MGARPLQDIENTHLLISRGYRRPRDATADTNEEAADLSRVDEGQPFLDEARHQSRKTPRWEMQQAQHETTRRHPQTTPREGTGRMHCMQHEGHHPQRHCKMHLHLYLQLHPPSRFQSTAISWVWPPGHLSSPLVGTGLDK